MSPDTHSQDIMELIARAPWREAVTYRETWPHEYVVIQRDGQQELLAEFCRRVLQGEGIEGHFYHQTRPYLFLAGYKYWVMDDVEDIDPETYDSVLNRALLYRDRRDFAIRPGDTAHREEGNAMATQDLGRISEVVLTDIWPHEAQNFTVWLSEPENLELLGASLGLDLEFVGREVFVGPFRLDILARDRQSGRQVAIENQLSQSDHSHLGQSITYAAEHRARYVVWIAPSFTAEHRAAIDWLNELAPRRVQFYAVEVRAIKIGDSLAAPDFMPVAVPRKWQGREMPSRIEAPSPDVIKHREFFAPLVDELEKAGFGQAEPDMQDTQYWCQHEHPGLWYVAGLDEAGAWVALWFWDNLDLGQRLYDSLKALHEDLEGEFDSELHWFDGDRRNGPNVSLITCGSIDDPPERLAEIRAWMLETLTRFREVFDPRLNDILADLEEE